MILVLSSASYLKDGFLLNTPAGFALRFALTARRISLTDYGVVMTYCCYCYYYPKIPPSFPIFL